jgi:hypothetical protein
MESDIDTAPTTEYAPFGDEKTTEYWREARAEWEQPDNTQTQAATPRAKDRR